MDTFSHLNTKGEAVMVDVSGKQQVLRTAKAVGAIRLSPNTLDLIRKNLLQKGDVLTVAKIAGIMGAKRTSDLIPLCHNIEIDHIQVDLQVREADILITAEARCTDKTGIEMEALTAVSIAALTVYDMCKAVDKNMEITGIGLVEKTKKS